MQLMTTNSCKLDFILYGKLKPFYTRQIPSFCKLG